MTMIELCRLKKEDYNGDDDEKLWFLAIPVLAFSSEAGFCQGSALDRRLYVEC